MYDISQINRRIFFKLLWVYHWRNLNCWIDICDLDPFCKVKGSHRLLNMHYSYWTNKLNSSDLYEYIILQAKMTQSSWHFNSIKHISICRQKLPEMISVSQGTFWHRFEGRRCRKWNVEFALKPFCSCRDIWCVVSLMVIFFVRTLVLYELVLT